MAHSQSIHGSNSSSNANPTLNNDSTKQQQSSPDPPPDITSTEPIIPRVGSMGSMGSMSSVSSAASSYNTFGTDQRNEEIFENVSLSRIINETDRDPLLLSSAISPSPKRVSPTSSPSHPHHQNHNNSNNTHEHEPILSALTRLYTHNLTNTKALSPSPRDDSNDIHHPEIKHQDLKHQNDNNTSTKHTKNSNIHTINRVNTKNNGNSVSDSSVGTIGNALLNRVRTGNEHMEDDGNLTDNDYDAPESNQAIHDEKKEDQNQNDTQSLDSILSSPNFMDNAITMYGHLDDALNNINELKSHQLQQIKSLRQRKKRKRRNIYSNITRNESEGDNEIEFEKHEHVDVNERVVNTMKTLISSTTKMGNFISSSTGKKSYFGVLFDKLSSSIAYMSYISISTITPFIYNMVEAVLLELYATIKDIIEYYDPDPKNNVLWRIIDKMNEIVEAIHGLLALSDCFYEISSDQDDEYEDDDDLIEKEKKD